MVLAIQALHKAVTELSWDFDSMVNVGEFQYGLNSAGISLLNTGTTDDGVEYESSFTLATTDMGTRNPKTCRNIELGVNTDHDITLTVTTDEQEVRVYTATPYKGSLQRITFPVGSDSQGRYWKIKISSMNPFTVDSIDGVFIVRNLGIEGY